MFTARNVFDEQTLELLPTAIYVCGAPDGIICQYNRRAAELWGREPKCGDADERFCGSLQLYLDGRKVPREEAPAALAIRDGVPVRNRDVEMERPDGSRVIASVTVDLLRNELRELEGAVVVSHDITERKLAEKTNAGLLAIEQARRANEFFATVCHELRVPLTAVLGWTRRLRRGIDDESVREKAFAVVERNAQTQARLLSDLLDFAGMGSGKLRLQMRWVELPAVVQAALDTISPTSETNGIRIESIIDPHVSRVRGDPERLQQIVLNLISNAIKFTPRGGRTEVQLQQLGDTVEVRVSDTGQGIAPDLLPQLFEPFRQGDASPSQAPSGFGLGLSIVRHLVDLHGGTVHAYSGGCGKGATFTVRLPCGSEAARENSVSAAA